MPQLDDPGIATGPRGEPLGPISANSLVVTASVLEPPLDQPARVQIAAARERDQPLGERTQLLGLRFGGDGCRRAEQARAMLFNVAFLWLDVRES